MEFIFILGLIAVLVIRWAVLRDRMAQMESQIRQLTARVDVQGQSLAEMHRQGQAAARAVSPPVAAPVASTPPLEPQPVRPVMPVAPVVEPKWDRLQPVEPPRVAPPRVEPAPIAQPTPQPAAARREWETILGGSWLNKLGVFVLVIGLALLLRYSFTQFGPLGRVTICLAASLSLLAAGAIFESKERYRIFARGLLGGGWAGERHQGERGQGERSCEREFREHSDPPGSCDGDLKSSCFAADRVRTKWVTGEIRVSLGRS